MNIEPQYKATIFAPNHEKTPVEEINSQLLNCLNAWQPDRIGTNDWPGYDNPEHVKDVFTAYWGDWKLHLCLSTDSWIAEECQEMAEDHSHKPPYNLIAKCTRRIELWSEDDPNMDHFNDYVSVLSEIEKAFPGAIVFDNGELITD